MHLKEGFLILVLPILVLLVHTGTGIPIPHHDTDSGLGCLLDRRNARGPHEVPQGVILSNTSVAQGVDVSADGVLPRHLVHGIGDLIVHPVADRPLISPLHGGLLPVADEGA